MSGKNTSGYGSEEPQCYNCGASGHWAVACPEPTRQTPAGLTAWRNSSHAGPGGGNGGNRDRRGQTKKHKGPIITKYGPPPGQHPQPPPPPLSSYSTPNAAYHAHTSFPPGGAPPPPGPPNYQPYPPPPPGYPPAQPPPDYPSQHHLESHYPPTPPGPPQGYPRPPAYNYEAQHIHGYPQQPPPPRPHYGPSPPGYHAYPERGPDPQRYPPPPLPPPSYGSPPTSSYGRSRSQSHGHPSEPYPRPHRSNHHGERNRGQPPQTPPGKKTTGPQNRSSSISSGPIQLPTPLIHSLPPKPPQSRNTQSEVQRGKHNKRSQDRKNRQRAHRQRDGNKNKEGERKDREASPAREAIDRPSSRRSNVSTDSQARATTKPDTSQSAPQEQLEPQIARETSPQKEVSSEKADEPAIPAELDNGKQASPESADVSDQEDDPWEWEFAKIFKESEAKHAPDEVGSPLPFAYHEEILLPRKWDAVCVASEFINPDNLEQYIRPAHETEYWPCIEFDPAFVVDGKFPCGESIPKHLRAGISSPSGEKEHLASPSQVDREDSRKRSLHQDSVEEDSDKRAAKRRRSSDIRKKDSYVPHYRKSGDRSRSRERRSASRGSPARSRSSSASSLNSLEAELLGISEDPKSPAEGRSPSPLHRRDESSRSPQMKRRRPRTESAYSRRW